jgi:GntR family transcriptional regulator
MSEAAYRRIERHLRELLAEGAGRTEPLPSEVELAERFGVSRMTARQAFAGLAADGLIVRYRSRGTFATVRVLEDVGTLARQDFLDRWEAQGYDIELRVLTYESRPAPASVAERFRVRPGASLTYLERLRSADGQRLAWDVRWMPAPVCSRIRREEFAQRSLFSLLPGAGFPVVEMGFEISAHPARSAEVRRLGCRRSATVLHREIVCTAPGGETVITGFSIYPGEHVTYRAKVAVDAATESH